MKTFKLILCALLLILGFTACSSEVEDGPQSQQDNPQSQQTERKGIVGKWKLVEQAGRLLDNVTEIYEFKSNYSYEYICDIGVEERYKHYKNIFSIEDGWVKEEGELNGYISITYPDGHSKLHHCWIKGNTMTIISKTLEEAVANGAMFYFSPYQKFARQ